MRFIGEHYKISKLMYLMLMDVSFFISDFVEPSTFENFEEKPKS